MYKNLGVYYNKNIDELKVYSKNTKEPVLYIQGFKNKYHIPDTSEMTLEMFIWLSVHYEEVLQAV